MPSVRLSKRAYSRLRYTLVRERWNKHSLVWLSDVHADHLLGPLTAVLPWLTRPREPGGILVTGDISVAGKLAHHLTIFAESFRCPVYFTLGNHDYYGSSFEAVKQLVRDLCSQHPNLVYLDSGPVWLNHKTVLMGCQGWGDGRAGVGARSNLDLQDRSVILDFRGQETDEYFAKLHSLGRASAAAFSSAAPNLLQTADHLILATHVPPFVGSLPPKREYGDYAPHYSNVSLGRAILRIARRFPVKRISVYCGHTHKPSVYSPLANVTVHVAQAHYEMFQVSGIIPFGGKAKAWKKA